MKINQNIPKMPQQNAKSSNAASETGENPAVIQSREIASNAENNKPQTRRVIADAKRPACTGRIDVRFNSISLKEQSRLIKELMNFPDDIQELLSQLSFGDTSEESVEKLLKQANQTINIELIKNMLESNSRQSVDRLIKLFQQAPGGTQNTEQIKEIMGLITQITPKPDVTQPEVLKNLVLLYLPWLPLAQNQDLEVKFELYKGGENENEDETALVVYVSTINLGRFRVVIIMSGLSIKIQIENYENDIQNDINKKECLQKILNEINTQTQKDKISAITEILLAKNKESKQHEKKREVIISPTGNVSPVVILVAHKVSKIILEMDEKTSLIQARKEMN